MTPQEQAYADLCFAVWQRGFLLSLERFAAGLETWNAMAFPVGGSEARAQRARASFYVVRN